jgi:hypothetical protein
LIVKREEGDAGTSENVCRFWKRALQITVEAMTLFKELRNDLSLFRFDSDAETSPLSFCINPFLGIITSTLGKIQPKAYPTNTSNQLIIEKLVAGLSADPKQELFWNLQYFLSSLMAVTVDTDANLLLKLPLFLTYSQK